MEEMQTFLMVLVVVLFFLLTPFAYSILKWGFVQEFRYMTKLEKTLYIVLWGIALLISFYEVVRATGGFI